MWPLPHAKAQKGSCIAWCPILAPQRSQLLPGMKAELFTSRGCAAASPALVTLLTCCPYLCNYDGAETWRFRGTEIRDLYHSSDLQLVTPTPHPTPSAALGLGTLRSAPASSSLGFLQSWKTHKHPAAAGSLLGCRRDPALGSARPCRHSGLPAPEFSLAP